RDHEGRVFPSLQEILDELHDPPFGFLHQLQVLDLPGGVRYRGQGRIGQERLHFLGDFLLYHLPVHVRHPLRQGIPRDRAQARSPPTCLRSASYSMPPLPVVSLPLYTHHELLSMSATAHQLSAPYAFRPSPPPTRRDHPR